MLSKELGETHFTKVGHYCTINARVKKHHIWQFSSFSWRPKTCSFIVKKISHFFLIQVLCHLIVFLFQYFRYINLLTSVLLHLFPIVLFDIWLQSILLSVMHSFFRLAHVYFSFSLVNNLKTDYMLSLILCCSFNFYILIIAYILHNLSCFFQFLTSCSLNILLYSFLLRRSAAWVSLKIR